MIKIDIISDVVCPWCFIGKKRLDNAINKYKDYKFDSKLNQRMQSFLLDLDAKRGTDSRKIIPWCFE